MTHRYNPFNPNLPAHKDLFIGRDEELLDLNRSLFQTKNNESRNIMLIGERGIGKTSLLNVAREFAVGDNEYLGHKYNFLSIYVVIKDSTKLIDFIKDIKRKISNEIKRLKFPKKIFKNIFDEVIKLEAFGVKYNKDELSDIDLIDEFNNFLVEITREISNTTIGKDGLLFIIDEADKSNMDLNIGAFLKTLIESLHTENVRNVMIVMGGLPYLKEVLLNSHESSLRLFVEKKLSFLSQDDVIELVQKGITKGNDFSGTEIEITPKALDNIYFFSEGNPHYVQLIAEQIFEFNSDERIDEEDVKGGVLGANGAISKLGDLYYYKFYYIDITSVNHRKVLDIMADNWNKSISRTKIKNKFGGEDSTLDSALASLKKKNIILKEDSIKGMYRLQRASFAYWIKNHKHW